MKNQDNDLTITVFVFIFLIALFFIIGGFCWPYTIHGIGLLNHKDIHISFAQGGLLGLIPGIGQLSIIAMAVTWIVLKVSGLN